MKRQISSKFSSLANFNKRTNGSLSVGKSPDSKAAISTSNFVVFIAFILFFVYGFVLLMASYTGGSIIQVVGTCSLKHGGVFAVVPQAAGLVAGVIFLKFLTKNFSLRTIMIAGWSIAAIFLSLNTFIDKIYGGDPIVGTTLFCIFNFMFGLGISGVSPGLGIFFSRRFTGKNRIVMLGACQGCFGVGAGILPLVLASFLYQDNSSIVSIDSVRYFLVIATCLAFFCIWLSMFMKVPKASSDELKMKLTKKELVNQNKKGLTVFNFRIILSIAILCYILYMFCETVGSYNIQKFVNDNLAKQSFSSKSVHINYKKLMVVSIRCAGLLSFTEGVTRTMASIFICPRVRLRHYLTISLIILIGGFAFTMTGKATHELQNGKPIYAYILAIWLGVGIGNIWPTLNSFLNDIDNKRAALISIHINRTTSFMILISQSIAAAMLNYSGFVSSSKNIRFYLLIGAGIVCACGLIVVLWVFTWWLKSQKITHPDEYKKVIYQRETVPSWVKN